jgi:hypothetical protein
MTLNFKCPVKEIKMDTVKNVFKIVVLGALTIAIILIAFFGVKWLIQNPKTIEIVEEIEVEKVVEVEAKTSEKHLACWDLGGYIDEGNICVFPEECPACPPCETPEVAEKPTPVASDYNCKAVEIGGPVEVDGECSWCTVNYSYPGEVYIATSEPITYEAGAWVWQYQNPNGDIDAYTECMNAQPFMADPDYTDVWPD